MDKVQELLTRGVDRIYPSKEALEKVLRSGKKLKLYQGFDPTGTQLHIGHMTGLRKLRHFQNLGHHVIFLIGDGTGQAGDPSGKTTSREKFLTRDQLRDNAKNYVEQAAKIVRFDGENPVDILYNGDWLNKLTLVDILNIFDHFTHSQLAERDLFQQREKKGQEVIMREFIYPVLQAYDSVAMNVDLEIGGTDQTFNMLAGRTLVKTMQNREKFVLTTPLLTDSQGRKIGKTEGNVIGITDRPNELFGKIMSLSDDIIIKALEYLTSVPMKEIQTIKRALDAGENPIDYKKKLAREIVRELHSENAAQEAQEYFEKTVQNQELPANIPIYQYIGQNTINIIDLLIKAQLADSRARARRLVEQGGVKIDGSTIKSFQAAINVKNGMTIQAGKRKFLKLVVRS
ncbi:tyrosine--tRNA ligase [Candidatus Microgenomates bacterium]|nr:tyrosine--tRNA ligase [Candidatus Microgenomates bacterium]